MKYKEPTMGDSMKMGQQTELSDDDESTGDQGSGWKNKKKGNFNRRWTRDGCFTECVFEREGLLTGSTVNKQSLLNRLKTTLEGNNEWYNVALASVDKCFSSPLNMSANATCKSGSDEIITCIFREMFLACPKWKEGSSYCQSLKEFYQRCPNGPPPLEFKPKHHNHLHHHLRNADSPTEAEEEQDESTAN